MASPNGLGRISVQILALRFHVLSHHTLHRASFYLKIGQEYFLHNEESFGMLKTRFGGTRSLFGIPGLFLASLLLFFLREMGQNGVSGQVLFCFAPFLLQWYSLLNVDDSYKNDTTQVSEWWDMRYERMVVKNRVHAAQNWTLVS